MSCVVVIREREDLHILRNKFSEEFHPALHLRPSIDDRFFPRLRLFLDSFAVAQSPNIGKVRGDQIRLGFHFPWPRDPGLIDQRKRYSVLP